MEAGYKIKHCKIRDYVEYVSVENWHSKNTIEHDTFFHYPEGLKGVFGIVGIWRLKTLKK